MADYIGAIGKWATQPVVWIWHMIPKGGETIIIREIHGTSHGKLFFRVGALSTAAAVALGTYVAPELEQNESNKVISTFDYANRYHMIGSLGLLAVPLANRPYISGMLLTSGMIVFCGSSYWHAMSGDDGMRKFSPYGKMLLIAGLASMTL